MKQPSLRRYFVVDIPIQPEFIEAITEVTPQVTPQVEKLIKELKYELSRMELQELLDLDDRMNFKKIYIQPALIDGLIEMTIPDKPNSSKQKYRLTEKGLALQKKLNEEIK